MARKKRYERDSMASSLLTFLNGRGWNLTEIRKQYPDKVISLPLVAVYFLPSREIEAQLGRDHKAYFQPVQVDCYMESEDRAELIADDVADFMDDVPIVALDPLNSNAELASVVCYDTNSIFTDVLPPVPSDTELLRWRGIAKCDYEVHYF